MVSSMAPGSMLNLRLVHNGETRYVTLTLGELPQKEMAAAPREKPSPAPAEPPRLGIAVGEITPEIAVHLKLPPDTKGIVIADVEDGSAAEDAGLQPGDVIQEIDRKSVSTIGEFRTIVSKRRPGPVLLVVNREGHTLFVALEPR